MKQEVTRRDFVKTAAVAGVALGSAGILHAQTKKPINAVIIGCGGRGSGAGKNFLDACKSVGVEGKIVAVADIMEEKAKKGMKNFGVPEEKCFSGFDGYMKAINEPGVNYVIIATPPGFKAAQFKAAIEAGKHVFVEKPVAVDGPTARIMYAAGEVATQKGLKVAAGTQRRHQAGYLETIKQIHDGAIGDIVALRAYWVNGGPIWHRAKEEAESKTALEKQVRNWYHYIWLCGDHICEQHVHNLDVCNWIMKDHPVKAWGQGSRQQLGDKSGEIWDNFDCEFEYASGAHMFSYCGQVKRSWSSVSEAVHGTKGTSNPAGSYTPYGQKEGWKSTLELQSKNPYEQEHIDLINAILNNTELNETKNVTDSTLTAIMGREASYSGAAVTWDDIMKSEFRYGPDLLYDDCSKMTWGDFRTLKPPMPSQHSIFKKPAEIPTV